MDINLILTSIGVFLVMILLLVIVLLVAKRYLSPSGKVNISINGKDNVSVEQGGNLFAACLRRYAVGVVAVDISAVWRDSHTTGVAQ